MINKELYCPLKSLTLKHKSRDEKENHLTPIYRQPQYSFKRFTDVRAKVYRNWKSRILAKSIFYIGIANIWQCMLAVGQPSGQL